MLVDGMDWIYSQEYVAWGRYSVRSGWTSISYALNVNILLTEMKEA